MGLKYPPKIDEVANAANVGIGAFRVEKKAGTGAIADASPAPPSASPVGEEQMDAGQRKAMAGKVKALKKKIKDIEVRSNINQYETTYNQC